MTLIFRANDGRCAEAKLQSHRAELLGERAHARDRWSGMAEEWIENDGSCAGGGGGAGVVEGEDTRH